MPVYDNKNSQAHNWTVRFHWVGELLRGWWPGCEGVVCPAPEGAGRMMQSKPERSEGFDVIIRPAHESAGQTTPEQTGHYSHYNTNSQIRDIFTEIRTA